MGEREKEREKKREKGKRHGRVEETILRVSE